MNQISCSSIRLPIIPSVFLSLDNLTILRKDLDKDAMDLSDIKIENTRIVDHIVKSAQYVCWIVV